MKRGWGKAEYHKILLAVKSSACANFSEEVVGILLVILKRI